MKVVKFMIYFKKANTAMLTRESRQLQRLHRFLKCNKILNCFYKSRSRAIKIVFIHRWFHFSSAPDLRKNFYISLLLTLHDLFIFIFDVLDMFEKHCSEKIQSGLSEKKLIINYFPSIISFAICESIFLFFLAWSGGENFIIVYTLAVNGDLVHCDVRHKLSGIAFSL